MLMNAASSQLLIVDMQDRLLEAVPDKTQVLERCIRLVRAASILGLPVTVSEQYPKGLGPTVEPLRQALGNTCQRIEKIEFSCFGNAALRARLQALRRKGRPQVILGGIEAHICVTQTAIDLVENGFSTFVAADATGSRVNESAVLALDRLNRDGARIVDSEMVLFEWLGKAGTPEFKEIQALVK
jgi:nicotinamidase-related amidase